jgi:hypothetical protein
MSPTFVLKTSRHRETIERKMGWFSRESEPGASIPSSRTEAVVELRDAVVEPLRSPAAGDCEGRDVVEAFENEGAVLVAGGASLKVGE